MTATHRVFSIFEHDGKPNWLGIEGKKYDSTDDMLRAVDTFLTDIGPTRIISVHGMDGDSVWIQGVVVWYWQGQ